MPRGILLKRRASPPVAPDGPTRGRPGPARLAKAAHLFSALPPTGLHSLPDTTPVGSWVPFWWGVCTVRAFCSLSLGSTGSPSLHGPCLPPLAADAPQLLLASSSCDIGFIKALILHECSLIGWCPCCCTSTCLSLLVAALTELLPCLCCVQTPALGCSSPRASLSR